MIQQMLNCGLIGAVCAGAVFGNNPASSAVVVFLLLAYSIADKYFHDSFHDENKKEITQLKADYSKIKSKQDQMDLKGAFERRSATA